MNGFKLLAIRPLKGCDVKYLKNLKEGLVYKFYQDYRFNDLNGKEILNENNNLNETIINIESPQNEIDIYSEGELKINISALVGMNGSGKSSLIELLFLSNYLLASKNNILDSNLKIDKFKVELYYQIHENLFCVQIDEKFVEQKNLGGDKKTKRNYILKNVLDDNTFEFDDFFYTIAINYSLYGLNSNLLGNWIESLFHKNDAYQTPIVINPYRDYGNINVNREIYLSKQRLISNLLKPIHDQNDNHRIITDFQKAKYVIYSINDNKINYAYKKKEEGKELNISFDDIYFGFEYDSYSSTFSLISKENFINEVIKTFLGSEFDIVIGKSVKHYDKIEKYIIKKLVQIARTYPKYKEFFSEKSETYDIPIPGQTKSDKIKFPTNSFNKTSNYLSLLFEDESHITFKLRQAINYLIVNPFENQYEVEIELPKRKINGYKVLISDFSDLIFPHAQTQKNVIRFIPPSLFDLEIEFHLIKNDRNPSYFGTLSSGEQQLIQSVQSILYHINNLESVFDDRSSSDEDKKRYSCVNIILDEIELYFHPEFQRKFIAHLRKRIEELKTDRIKKFNILFATHSPFILSDIQSNNILRLENGVPTTKVMGQTFGANIHDLLAGDFFLKNGFMGEFSKEKINDVINWLNHETVDFKCGKIEEKRDSLEDNSLEKSEIDKKIEKLRKQKNSLNPKSPVLNKTLCKEIISIIGEPVLKAKLSSMLYEISIDDDEIKYMKEIEDVKKKYGKI